MPEICTIGTVERYEEGEDFDAYIERFEHFLVANDIMGDASKQALFLTLE